MTIEERRENVRKMDDALNAIEAALEVLEPVKDHHFHARECFDYLTRRAEMLDGSINSQERIIVVLERKESEAGKE